jgi:hypothetical protein
MTASEIRDGIDEFPAGPSRLRVSVSAPSSRARARELLGSGRHAWLGDPVASDAAEDDRYLLDLELRVSDRTPRVTFTKAAFVDIGPLVEEAGTLSVAISWRAAGLTPLFPIFAGRLSWSDDELRLDGYYEPPGGNAGIVIDRLLLNTAARATGRRLLAQIAEVLRAT